MPKHDLPDGHEFGGNLIDFREHLRRRMDRPAENDDAPEREPSKWDVYRHAEHGDGKLPALSWFDALWLAPIIGVGWMTWTLARRW